MPTNTGPVYSLPVKKSAPVGTVDPNLSSPALIGSRADVGAIDVNTERNITESFAKARSGLQARQDVNARNIENDITRQQAQTPGGFGGAGVKLRQKAITEAAQGFQGDQAGIDTQEAQAKAAFGEAKAGRAMTFGQLAQQNEQFAKTMNYQYAELDENQKTNLINALAVLKQLKFDKYDLANVYKSGVGEIYGDRLPPYPYLLQEQGLNYKDPNLLPPKPGFRYGRDSAPPVKPVEPSGFRRG